MSIALIPFHTSIWPYLFFSFKCLFSVFPISQNIPQNVCSYPAVSWRISPDHVLTSTTIQWLSSTEVVFLFPQLCVGFLLLGFGTKMLVSTNCRCKRTKLQMQNNLRHQSSKHETSSRLSKELNLSQTRLRDSNIITVLAYSCSTNVNMLSNCRHDLMWGKYERHCSGRRESRCVRWLKFTRVETAWSIKIICARRGRNSALPSTNQKLKERRFLSRHVLFRRFLW